MAVHDTVGEPMSQAQAVELKGLRGGVRARGL
jgi:hypothetical protein